MCCGCRAGCISKRFNTWGGLFGALHLPWVRVSLGTPLPLQDTEVAVCAQSVPWGHYRILWSS